MALVEKRLSLTVLKVEEHSRASVETTRLDVGTRERTAQRRCPEAMVADLEEVAVENNVTTAIPRAIARKSAGNSILN